MQIYLDYSATTPPRAEAIALMQEVMVQQWGNPSSLHQWGERAAIAVERARSQVASLIQAEPESIIFTSGGTEADNLAIMGVARLYRQPQHLIISSVEHSAVSEPAKWLQELGWQVTRLAVDATGRVDPMDLQRAIQANTVLISVIYGQSEVGTVQPIEDLGAIAREHHILFHTDAVQVAGRLPLTMQQLPVDLLSLSSHKLYGPQGAGALYVRPGVKLRSLLEGGGQEQRLRSGTQAVPAIAGFGIAAELAAQELVTESERLRLLRDRLFEQLADVPELIVTGDRVHRLPHHVSFCLRCCDGQQFTGKTLVRHMNMAGIGISSGSACNSGKTVPSPTLLAMGLGDRLATGGIRLTLGHHTTADDVDWAATVLKQVLARLSSTCLLSV
ncbi:cysteine desulfurase family protein [Leptolyngbya sp. AN02str]|uniref:cysteine desulfurase family protein n=1 Tax=Leptolyngbya sp. AN02str TaxID=3423363 RepID=UPI003D31FBCA